MRVLHFYKTYFPDTVGGVEQAINQICRKSPMFGIEAEVLSLTRQRAPSCRVIDGHKVHFAQTDFEIASTRFSLDALRQFKNLAAQADIVHYHFPWPFADMAHFLTRMHKPCLVSYHSDIVRQKNLLKLYRPLMNRFLKSVDAIVASSPNYLATSETLRPFHAKTTVVPLGLDETTYAVPSPEVMDSWRSRLGQDYFLFVGVLRYYKGLHILLDAVAGTDFPIVIVGSGPVEAELQSHAKRLGLSNVKFLGFLNDADKAAVFKLCRAVVFPSHLRSEAFGLSLLEGAMYGKPLISSEIGTGTSYINIGEQTGIVVPPNDPAALREALRRIVSDPERAAAMGRNARLRFAELFTGDHMMRGYAEVYKTLI